MVGYSPWGRKELAMTEQACIWLHTFKIFFKACFTMGSQRVRYDWVTSVHFTNVKRGFLWGSAGKESTSNAGDLGSIPRLGRSPGEGKGHWLQNSGLENSMDHIVHGVAKSWTWLNNFHSLGRMNRGYKDKKILLFHQVLDMKPKFFNTVNYIYPCFLLLLATIKKKPTMLSIR